MRISSVRGLEKGSPEDEEHVVNDVLQHKLR